MSLRTHVTFIKKYFTGKQNFILKLNDIHTQRDTNIYNIYEIFSNKHVYYRKIGRIVIDNVENQLNYRKMDRIRDYEVCTVRNLSLNLFSIAII